MKEIKRITATELRGMTDQEGLILQGCGGDLSEWVDGVNDLLTREGILKNGSTFTGASAFEHDGLTNLLLSFDGADLDVGRLAMWRLASHEQFGGTWLSDYVPNRLGGFAEKAQEQAKPDCPLIGQDGNVFNLMGIAARTLKEHGLAEQAKEMRGRITESGNYSEALCIIGEYVNITDSEDAPELEDGFEMRQGY